MNTTKPSDKVIPRKGEFERYVNFEFYKIALGIPESVRSLRDM